MSTVLVTCLCLSLALNIIQALKTRKFENFIMAERNEFAFREASTVTANNLKSIIERDEEPDEDDELTRAYEDALMRGEVSDRDLIKMGMQNG